MSTEGKSSSKKRHDSQMDPQKTVEEDDSGLGTSKSQTPSSSMTSGEAHDPEKAGPSRSVPGPSSTKSPGRKTAPGISRTKSPAKKSAAPGALEKSPLKRAGRFIRSSSPKPPEQGASPKKIAARTSRSGDMQKRTALVETDPDTGLARQVQNPPPPDRSPSPPVRRYPTRQSAKKKGREKYQ